MPALLSLKAGLMNQAQALFGGIIKSQKHNKRELTLKKSRGAFV
jgi:hypothetical protein